MYSYRMKSKPRRSPKLELPMDADLKRKLAKAAKENERSMAAEARHALRKHLA